VIIYVVRVWLARGSQGAAYHLDPGLGSNIFVPTEREILSSAYLKLANPSFNNGKECNADSHHAFLPQKPCSTTEADMQQCMCIAMDVVPDLVRAS
jgi:hypothetical protein